MVSLTSQAVQRPAGLLYLNPDLIMYMILTTTDTWIWILSGRLTTVPQQRIPQSIFLLSRVV